MKLAVLFRTPLFELQRRMPFWEFNMWRAYIAVEPLGDDRADINAAMIVHAIDAYIWARGGGKGRRPSLQDSIVDYWRSPTDGRGKQTPLEKKVNLLASIGVLPGQRRTKKRR